MFEQDRLVGEGFCRVSVYKDVELSAFEEEEI